MTENQPTQDDDANKPSEPANPPADQPQGEVEPTPPPQGEVEPTPPVQDELSKSVFRYRRPLFVPKRYTHKKNYVTKKPIEEFLEEFHRDHPQLAKLDQQIEESKKRFAESMEEAAKAVLAKSKEAAAKYRELQARHDELQQKQELRHLLDRVNDFAKPILLQSAELRSKFDSSQLFTAYIMSIDIRRSTDLMLKAKSQDDFAGFISTLCENLRDEILGNFGVFDKFTGDGILAFFPDFFSGDDAGYRALLAAEKCHAIFREHYRASRRCFSAVILETGLGIGIDYGFVKFVRVGQELTVVGEPVVYACRLGGAPAGCTYLNQPARNEIFDRYSAYSTINETQLTFKHDGPMLAYHAQLNEKVPTLADPTWLTMGTDGDSAKQTS